MPAESQTNYSEPSCSPQYPCNRFYHCDRCARRRQARWADVAERIDAAFGALQFSVITPDENTQQALESAKRSAMRTAMSPAYIWSVEVGQQCGHLHLNLLGPDLGDIRIKNASIHTAPVREGARAAAAYMTKRSGLPARPLYSGRTVGTAGHIMEHLSHAKHMPVAQAGALLKIIETARFNKVGASLPPTEITQDLRKIAQHFTTRLDELERAMHANMRK